MIEVACVGRYGYGYGRGEASHPCCGQEAAGRIGMGGWGEHKEGSGYRLHEAMMPVLCMGPYNGFATFDKGGGMLARPHAMLAGMLTSPLIKFKFKSHRWQGVGQAYPCHLIQPCLQRPQQWQQRQQWGQQGRRIPPDASWQGVWIILLLTGPRMHLNPYQSWFLKSAARSHACKHAIPGH